MSKTVDFRRIVGPPQPTLNDLELLRILHGLGPVNHPCREAAVLLGISMSATRTRASRLRDQELITGWALTEKGKDWVNNA